ncbi:MAG: Mut7-C RNAse domain-containing protein [Candidatus Saelkia tenebricola]|nr:Mut7-C RNAse domain-containing protein [Candidatus Saelkia tenebricola]
MKFILSSELGKLSKWLRILNYDTYYFKGRDRALALKALQDGRIILTKKKDVFKEPDIKIVVLNQEKLLEQIRELKNLLDLTIDIDNLFLRCTRCNAETVVVDKKNVKGKVPLYVYQKQKEFYRCSLCGKIFWPGTHRDLAGDYLSKIENDNC